MGPDPLGAVLTLGEHGRVLSEDWFVHVFREPAGSAVLGVRHWTLKCQPNRHNAVAVGVVEEVEDAALFKGEKASVFVGVGFHLSEHHADEP